MGFADKLKDMAKQAQETVAEHKDEVHKAVETASVVANKQTHGKYSGKIAKFSQKADQAVDKLETTEEHSDAEHSDEEPHIEPPPAA